jgi:RNA polymerase sigma-70 factor (ECF subfamily)
LRSLENYLSNIDNDIALFHRIADRDKNALGNLYDKYSKYLYSIIYFILKNKNESEDVLQEVFLSIWEKIYTYDESLGNPLSWMTRISNNRAIDKIRARKNFSVLDDELELKALNINEDSKINNPESNFLSLQEKNAVTKALFCLDENQRVLIEFAYFKGLSQSELAKFFKIPLGTVKTRIRAGMILLREKLKHLY